jgi:hypothetical protein
MGKLTINGHFQYLFVCLPEGNKHSSPMILQVDELRKNPLDPVFWEYVMGMSFQKISWEIMGEIHGTIISEYDTTW